MKNHRAGIARHGCYQHKAFSEKIQGRQTGLGYIALIVIVAIVAIIAVVVVPKYQVYLKRSKMAEVIDLLDEVRVAMNTYHMKNGSFVANFDDMSKRNRRIGLNGVNDYKTDVIEKVWVGSTGVQGKDDTSAYIAITFNADLELSDSGEPVLLSTIEFKNGDYEFVCGNNSSILTNNISAEYLPSSCRN